MSISVDDFGIWSDIGQVTVTKDWQLFNELIYSGNIYRFTYIVDWEEWDSVIDTKSYGLIRFYYPYGNTFIVTPSERIYPKQFQEIRDIPKAFKTNEESVIAMRLGVKGIRTGNSYLGNIEIFPWTLRVEYLVN